MYLSHKDDPLAVFVVVNELEDVWTPVFSDLFEYRDLLKWLISLCEHTLDLALFHVLERNTDARYCVSCMDHFS